MMLLPTAHMEKAYTCCNSLSECKKSFRNMIFLERPVKQKHINFDSYPTEIKLKLNLLCEFQGTED